MTARRRRPGGVSSTGLERLSSDDPADWLEPADHVLLAELVEAFPDRRDELEALGGDSWLTLTPPGFEVSDVVRERGLLQATRGLVWRRRRDAVRAEAERRDVPHWDLAERVGLGWP